MNTIKKMMALIIILLMTSALFAANTDIRLNSIGYRTGSVKKASIKAATVTTFYVKTYPSGPTVLTATASNFGSFTDKNAPAEQIWIADFSAVTAPGTYFLSVPGVGTSYSFTINNNAYEAPFYTVFRGFYLWRCGMSVSGVHNSVTYSHVTCHANDGYLDYVGGGHVKKDGTGGWHDAGDYNKYVTNANVTFGVLGKAWEFFKENIESVALNLPETAPGYPEYLKELKWETDWLLKMQAADGRVYHKLSANDFSSDWVMPQLNTQARYYIPFSTAAAADFVAMMAQAYRLFIPYDSGYANQCLDKARLSYGYLTTTTSNLTCYNTVINNSPAYYNAAKNVSVTTGSYETTDPDDRLWAAAEMWEATGEAIFLTDFETRAGAKSNKISSSMDWGDVSTLGMYTYYNSGRAGRNTAIVDDIRNDTISTANTLISNKNSHGYARVEGTSYWWGINGIIARTSITLYMAYRMTGSQSYVDAGQDILGYLFGRNLYCRSMVTGLGNNPPLHPHDRRSANDGISAPWPGYVIGGPQPNANSWVDSESDFTTSEIAINWNAGLVFTLAWMMRDPAIPTPTITGTPPTETATPTITETPTITQTHTISPTSTITPTVTITPTEIFDTLEIKECFTYPNPSTNAPIKFRFHNDGYVKTLKIKIFTISDRKVGEVNTGNFGSSTKSEVEWDPPYKQLGNGMYYYILEAQGENTAIVRKNGTFVILKK